MKALEHSEHFSPSLPSRLLPVCLAVLSLSMPARAESIDELVRRADRVLRGNTSAAVVHMDVKTRTFERSYEMVIWDDSSGKVDRTLVKILGPTSFRGYATLRVGGELEFYDPKTNHVQTVGSSMLGDSWMGSHFSNDDLVKETELAVDYTPTLEASHQGTTELGDRAVFDRVRLLPRPTAPVVWGRIEFELWVRADAVVPVRSEYYTRAGDSAPARVMTFSAVRELGGRLVPTEMEVTVASKPGEYTRLTYDKLRFDVDIPASKFTEQALH